MRGKMVGVVAGVVLCLAGPLHALLNGFSVTTMRTYCHNDWTLYFSLTYGHIVKFTIQEGNVVRTDTLYKPFPASFPTINLQGTQIAFIRKDGGTVKKHLMVMNADGSNVRELDAFDGFYGNGCCERRAILDWPAGDWIYYNHKGNDLVAVDSIFKIDVNNPANKRLVFVYNGFTAFSLSLDATKASIVTGNCAVPGVSDAWYCNAVHTFPPTSEPRGDWPAAVSYGCGSYISPSGNNHVHFQDQGHSILGVNTLVWSNHTASATVDVHQNPSFAQWSGLPQDSVGADKMWYPRWAVNSDKWICALSTNAKGMYMQMLVNWVDHKAIPMPHGPDVTKAACPTDGDQMERNTEAGDLWVAGGPCGTYEDVNGNWVPTSVTAGCATGAASPLLRCARTDGSVSQRVNVYTMQGKLIGTWDRNNLRGRASVHLAPGSYVVRPASGQPRVGSIVNAGL